MNSNAFLQGVMTFYDAINENVEGIEQVIENINTAFKKSFKNLKLGRIKIKYFAPTNSFEPNGITRDDELVLCDNWSEEGVITKLYTTNENGNVEYFFYPISQQSWDEHEKGIILQIIKNCYIFSGRARVFALMKKCLITDRLTGALNMDGFSKNLGMLCARKMQSQYIAAFLNFKNFKYINKLFGSKQGDIILRYFSLTMQDFIGGDGYLSRLGGDNFVLVIKKERLNELIDFINNFSYDTKVGLESRKYYLNFRMGVYNISDNDGISEIMNKVSTAYNTTRYNGQKDIVFFTPKHLELSLKKNEISTLFPHALADGEFVVYYQPKVALENNRLCGCEALCRWIKNGEVVLPMNFIPVLEDEGTICNLDFYILDKVCADIRRWIDSGIGPVKVSVNFSKLHIHNTHLVEEIMAIIKKYDIDSSYIEIELTEITDTDNLNTMKNFINEMKNAGITTSIDDFGTGYSSLNLLKDLNVDIIKLDKTFFTNINESMPDSSTDKVLVKNIVNMVNELNMEALSEGVETSYQADFLRNIKCSIAQGFLFDKPLAKEEFEKRLLDDSNYKNRC